MHLKFLSNMSESLKWFYKLFILELLFPFMQHKNALNTQRYKDFWINNGIWQNYIVIK